MPGITLKNAPQGNSSCVSGSRPLGGFRSKLGDGVSYDQLQKFWSELSPAARNKLLRIDKQTLLEQARKNLYCSRCNGLLLEGFSQIITYGKSLQHEHGVNFRSKSGSFQTENDGGPETASIYCQDDAHDPMIHPWGGLAATRDGMLTLLDCFLHGKSLDRLQNVFDSARAREHERELLYPDACGGEGRGWISQGMINYGRGHGIRETCALHTARLSCETLVDFWSALGDETCHSLLQMKEDDFIERLIHRFDNKRFCRDCRRNVIREFKELKELRRMRRETHCTNWFCVADTAFQYEVSSTTIQADWHQSFSEAADAYHHFECAVGTGEGKSDICGFEDVGMSWSYQVDGLDLAGFSACFITLRAWRLDGRCIELYVKAHALKGQPCVHRRLVVGDGFVTINTGDNIREFFEHAEDAEEEEDDNSVDSDGNDIDDDGSRPQRHAKSPELAREFLLDAASVIFKEQVEKAFREGTARQNAHSTFVCLALKLLEDRIHVACKEIIALQKQIKLLEEEEKEKHDEERRKERRKTKEREKKLRRREKMRGKEKGADDKHIQTGDCHSLTASTNNSSLDAEDESCHTSGLVDSIQEKDDVMPVTPRSPQILDGKVKSMEKNSLQYSYMVDEVQGERGNSNLFSTEQIKLPRGKVKFRKKHLLDPASKWHGGCNPVMGDESHNYIEELEEETHGHRESSSTNVNGVQRQPRYQLSRASFRTYSPKFSGQRTYDGYHSRSFNRVSHCAYRVKTNQATVLKSSCITNNQASSIGDIRRPLPKGEKFNGGFSTGCRGVLRGKGALGNTNAGYGEVHTKKVWEPLESRKKCARSNSNSIVSSSSDAQKDDRNAENSLPKSWTKDQSSDTSQNSVERCAVDKSNCHECINDSEIAGKQSDSRYDLPHQGVENSGDGEAVSCTTNFNDGMCCASDPSLSASCSDSSSSCPSEGDFSTATSCIPNAESLPTSDSEDASPSQSIDSTLCSKCSPDVDDCGGNASGDGSFESTVSAASVLDRCHDRALAQQPRETCYAEGNGTVFRSKERKIEMEPHQHSGTVHNQIFPFPVIPSHTMGYYRTTTSWPAFAANGLLPFSHPDNFLLPDTWHSGLTTNGSPDYHMMYGAFYPLNPALNVGQVPFYPFESDGINSTEYSMSSNMRMSGAADTRLSGEASAVRKVNENFERSFLNHDHFSSEASPHLPVGGHGNFSSHCDPVFSLFHFGSRAVGSDGKPSLKREVIGNIRSHSQISPPVQVDVAQTKKEGIIEEYSLFASKK